MSKIKKIAIALHISIGLTLATPLNAFASSVSELRSQMDQALCDNNWELALSTADQILEMPRISDNYREDLTNYRASIVAWRDSGQEYTFDGCEGTALNWDEAVSSISPGAGDSQSSGGSSIPRYFRTTCAQFSTWQEAQFHFMNGSAPLTMDGDGDGIACEVLPVGQRSDGTVSRRISASGVDVEVVRESDGDYYVRLGRVDIEGIELPPFSTVSFPSGTAAREHYYRYYSGR